MTVEDPVEYEIAGVTQVPVNEKKGLTFARGLRSILRHDPDTIMVGEVRDPETASIAVQAALTGHLVLTTVHANHALDVVGRFLHMGADPHNFVSALNCIVAQRLVRVLCRECRQPVPPRCGRAGGPDGARIETGPALPSAGLPEMRRSGVPGTNGGSRDPVAQLSGSGTHPGTPGRTRDPSASRSGRDGLAAPKCPRTRGARGDDSERGRSGNGP